MSKVYDLVVVGAGPAGLMAAVTAAKEGLAVALVERKTEIASVRRSCCSMIINEPDTHGECVTIGENKIVFHRRDFSVPYHGPFLPLKQCIRFSPKGLKLLVERKEDPVSIAINKEMLLEGLLKEAKASGVTVFNGTQGIKAENSGSTVIVTVQQEDRTFELTGKTAIASDGLNSRLVEGLGLNKGRKFIGTFPVLTYYMEGVECPHPPAWIVFVGKGHYPSQKGQLDFLPKPQRDGSWLYELSYGRPIIEGRPLREDLDWFISKSTFAPWFKKARVAKTLSAVLNFYTPLLEVRAGRILIVGDSACFIEVYNQGALMYGHAAAQSVAKYLKTGQGLDEYTEFWRKTFGYNQPGAIENTLLGFGLHVLEDDELDYLFSLTDKETYKGYVNEYTFPAIIMGAFMSHMGEIKRDRPDLAEKIEKLSQVPVEEFLQVDKKSKQ
jgi:flavin-dependent dehydrogenase